MAQAGATEAPARDRRPRPWVDFGVDETWQPAPSRRRHAEAWMDDAELFAPHNDLAALPEVARRGPRTTSLERSVEVRSRRTAAGSGADVAPLARHHGELGARRGAAALRESHEPAVSVDVLGHPAHLAAPEASGASRAPGVAVPGRRTVTIRGRGAERDLAFPEPGRPRRPPVRRHERPDFRPDRTALWALMLALVLVLVAATTSHAGGLSHTGHTRGAARSVVASPASARGTSLLVIRVQR